MFVLQNGKQMVQEGALTALASVADSSQVYYILQVLRNLENFLHLLFVSF